MVPDYAEALKLNKQLTDSLIRLFIELEDQQYVILEKHRILRAEIQFLKASKTRKDVKVKKLNFSKFGYPYFKDKDGEALPGKKQSAIFLCITFNFYFICSL